MGTLDANAADSQDSNQVETGKSHVRVVTEIVGLVAVLLPVAGAAILLFRYRLAGVPDAQKYALLTSLPELSALGLAAAIPFLLLLPIASNLQRDVAARRKMISKQREYLRKLSGSEAANETLDPEEIETYRRVAELNIDVASGDVMPDSREAFTVL